MFAISDELNQPPRANLAPLIVGFIVVAIGLSFGANAGYAINPARDFGLAGETRPRGRGARPHGRGARLTAKGAAGPSR